MEPNSHQYCIVLSTCPSQEVAESIAMSLVEKKLAACVNIVPGLISVYAWQGNIEKSQEHLLLAKTRISAYPAVESAILDRHPYELPEIISIPVNTGLAHYLSWIDDNVVSVS
ncbi:MAG TPA: divalent-cation tolerance protein CutA [Gammaproteobacteria bacterium]